MLNIALIIVGIICVSIVIIGLAFILIASGDKKKNVNVPKELEGLSEKDACKKIEKSDLNCVVEYAYDEDYEEYLCAADMDEDDYARLMNNPRSTCPFYQNGDEYRVVRKQM